MSRSVLLLAWLLSACTCFRGDSTVLITSDPPGARILVDGEDSGRTTPANMDLGGMWAGDTWITLRKRGYRDEVRLLTHYTEGYTSRWIDGAEILTLPPLPIFWTLGDFFVPFAVRWAYVPGGIYVKLYKEGEPVPTRTPPQAGLASR